MLSVSEQFNLQYDNYDTLISAIIYEQFINLHVHIAYLAHNLYIQLSRKSYIYVSMIELFHSTSYLEHERMYNYNCGDLTRYSLTERGSSLG